MATKIPPHNLREVIECHRADRAAGQPKEARLKAIIKLVPGPDFPTGGFIFGRQRHSTAYTTGRGSIIMRAKAATENRRRAIRK